MQNFDILHTSIPVVVKVTLKHSYYKLRKLMQYSSNNNAVIIPLYAVISPEFLQISKTYLIDIVKFQR